MNISSAAVVLFMLGLAQSVHCLGRPIDYPPIEILWARADLVAMIRPLTTTNAPDKLTSAGPNYGPRDPKDYQDMNTRFKVVLVMKTSEKLLGWRTNELTLLHFRYAESTLEFNGGLFMHFDFAPTELHLIVKGDATHPIYQDNNPTYLAFLKWAPDGRFHPATGQYDSEGSFLVLSTPEGSMFRYFIEDGIRKKQVEANQDGAAKVKGAGRE